MATVKTLIQKAMYKSTNDRQFFTVGQIAGVDQVALDIYKDTLDQYRNLIPYIVEKQLTNASELVNVGAFQVYYVNYILGNVKFRLREVNFQKFNYQSNIIDLKAVPSMYWYNPGDDTIHIYPAPSESSAPYIIGYTPNVIPDTIEDEIPSSITRLMQRFLQYEIAAQLADEYNVPWPAKKESQRMRLYESLVDQKQISVTAAPLPLIGGDKSLQPPWMAYLSGGAPT